MTREEIIKEIDEAVAELKDAKVKVNEVFCHARNIVMYEDNSEAYNKGLNDAWELAKKIDLFDEKERTKIFGYLTSEYIKERYTPQEVLAKLEAYEKEQNEIKLGDIIICYDKEGVVTKVDDNYFNIVYEDGSSDKISQIICKKKTGKHIDIQSVLKQIGGVE